MWIFRVNSFFSGEATFKQSKTITNENVLIPLQLWCVLPHKLYVLSAVSPWAGSGFSINNNNKKAKICLEQLSWLDFSHYSLFICMRTRWFPIYIKRLSKMTRFYWNRTQFDGLCHQGGPYKYMHPCIG